MANLNPKCPICARAMTWIGISGSAQPICPQDCKVTTLKVGIGAARIIVGPWMGRYVYVQSRNALVSYVLFDGPPPSDAMPYADGTVSVLNSYLEDVNCV